MTPVELAKGVMEELDITPVIDLFVAELTGLKFHSWAFQHQTYLLVAKICMVVMSLFPCRQWKKP